MTGEDQSPNARAGLETRLPPEIEHEILVQAFQVSSIEHRVNLLLVSKRAFTWLNPMIYQVVTMHEGSYTPPLSSLSKHGTHVVHTRLIGSFSSGLSSIESSTLSLCSNITNLFVWSTLSSNTIPRLFELRHLKRLLFHHPGNLEGVLINLQQGRKQHLRLGGHDYSDINLESCGDDPALVSRLEWCKNITHLAWGTFPDESQVPLLDLFPNLTHFLLGDWNSPNVVLEILKLCSQLKVLIWLLAKFNSREETVAIEASPKETKALDVDDLRVV
ncbi:hypothetical protein BDN72DRAFT_850015, partial [Pluteus cervinus]